MEKNKCLKPGSKYVLNETVNHLHKLLRRQQRKVSFFPRWQQSEPPPATSYINNVFSFGIQLKRFLLGVRYLPHMSWMRILRVVSVWSC